MATFNGFMRSAIATGRRIERAQQRSSRQAAAAYKQQQKVQELNNNAQQFKIYNDYITAIQSVHKDCSEVVDWNSFLLMPEPQKVTKKYKNEELAQYKLENYKPSFFDRLFNAENKKREKLSNQILIAKKKDDDEFSNLQSKYESDYQNWKDIQDLTKRIINKDPEAYRTAIQEFEPFSDIGELGSSINFSINSDYVVVNLFVRSAEVVPNYELKLTSTGKLSQKNLPKGRFYEIYQDYVCSCLLRIAREMFALLPLKMVFINAVGELLNTSTGLQEEQTIVSIAIPPTTLNKLNFSSIDPSDSLSNFVTKMKFNKTNGFQPVEKIDSDKFTLN
jgi:hypothetical protein